jgi:hypothetical protein
MLADKAVQLKSGSGKLCQPSNLDLESKMPPRKKLILKISIIAWLGFIVIGLWLTASPYYGGRCLFDSATCFTTFQFSGAIFVLATTAGVILLRYFLKKSEKSESD